jgi:DNA-binding NarL/FixJ family response regulator
MTQTTGGVTVIQRIFIVWVHPIFRETVRLLLKHPAIEIVGLSADRQTALAEMETLKPDTIIIEEAEDIVLTHSEVAQFLDACSWESRVIRLSLQDNEVWLYQQQRQSISSSEEFLQVIQNI